MTLSIKPILKVITVSLFLGIGFYRGCIATTNEIGYLGVDKDGRQIFIQTLDHFYQPVIKIDSDFFDYPIFIRFLQEPMRTTLRLHILTDTLTEIPTEKSIRQELSDSYKKILSQFVSTISINGHTKVPVTEIRKRLDQAGAKTMEDFFAGFGFKKYEVFKDGKKIVSVDLKQIKPNVKWIGGED